MRIIISLVFLLLAPGLPARAQEDAATGSPPAAAPEIGAETEAEADLEITLDIIQAGTHTLDEFLWLKRPLVIFADTPADPRFVQQMEYIHARPEDLIARDVVVIIDTAPEARSPIREALRPRGFALVLIGKDGQIYLRKPLPWRVREIVRSIDKMPIRKQELADRRLVRNP